MKQTLEQLIKSLKFDYTNKDITEENFPDDGRRGKVEIIDFKREITSEEAIKEMDEKGYRPATAYELLTWAKNWNGKDFIVELDSKWRRLHGYRCVLSLWGGAGGRSLSLHSFARKWIRHCRFAFVRKSVTEPLGTPEPFDPRNLEIKIGDKKYKLVEIK